MHKHGNKAITSAINGKFSYYSMYIFVATYQNGYVKMGCDVIGWYHDSISCCFYWHLYWRAFELEIFLDTQMYPWLLVVLKNNKTSRFLVQVLPTHPNLIFTSEVCRVWSHTLMTIDFVLAEIYKATLTCLFQSWYNV